MAQTPNPWNLHPLSGLTGFADTPTQGDISSDTLFSGRVDAFLKVKNIWPGGTVKGQLEFVDGDDAIGRGVAAVIWPTNSYSARPALAEFGQARVVALVDA